MADDKADDKVPDRGRERESRRILRDLEKLKVRIDKTEADLKALYASREAAFILGRSLVPPLVQREMGEAAGVTEAAVIHVVKRAGVRAAKAGK